MITPVYPMTPQNESGQSVIELAVSLPLFLILLLGTAEMANVAWAAIQINNAARAGAQFASQNHANAVDTTNIALTAKNDAPSITNMQVTSQQTCSCVDSSGNGGTPDPGCTTTTTSSCPSPSTIMIAVQVNTQAAITPFIRYPGLPASYTLHGQAIMGVVK